MNLKEQLYICTLARCQTISKAAEELYISPSALSTYVSNLEKYLGVKLFERTGKVFILTFLGEEYVTRAEKMLRMKDEFDSILEQTLKKGCQTIRIGIQQRRAVSVVPETLSIFFKEYPNMDVIIRDGTQDELVNMYKKGKVDYVVSIFRNEYPDACYQDIAEERVLVALPKNHPANIYAYSQEGDTYKHIDMKYLNRETFILPSVSQSMRTTAQAIFDQAEIIPGKVIEIGNFDLIMGMVNQGIGIGFNRQGYIHDMHKFSNISYYFIGKNPYFSRLVLAYHKDRKISECENRFLEILIEMIRLQY